MATQYTTYGKIHSFQWAMLTQSFTAYCEQVGVKRQEEGMSGEIHF